MPEDSPRFQETRSPAWARIFDEFSTRLAIHTRTLVLAEVVQFYRNEDRADVQPLTNLLTRDQGGIPLEPITRRPVIWPRFGPFVIKGQLEVGDEVVLVCMDRDVSDVVAKGGRQDPRTARRYSMNDSFVLPGWESTPKHTKTPSAPKTLLISENSPNPTTWIRLKLEPTGEVVIEGPAIKVGAAASAGAARVGDSVASGASLAIPPAMNMTTWIAAITAAVNTLAPGSATVPIDFGTIAFGSSKVTIE
jgi:hypothetical protein